MDESWTHGPMEEYPARFITDPAPRWKNPDHSRISSGAVTPAMPWRARFQGPFKNTWIPLLSTQAESACYPNLTKMKRTSNNFFQPDLFLMSFDPKF